MEKLMEILRSLRPDVDFDSCRDLIDGRYLDSLVILALVAELEEAFDITIPTACIVPANFNSAEAMWEMVTRLQEEG